MKTPSGRIPTVAKNPRKQQEFCWGGKHGISTAITVKLRRWRRLPETAYPYRQEDGARYQEDVSAV
jgi:hypothetical protein